MTLGPITITPDEKTAAALETVAQRSKVTPEEVALQIIAENVVRYLEPPETDDELDLSAIEGVLIDDTGIEKLPWSEIIGAFSSAEPHNDDERLEEILEEEWLRDADY